MNPVDAAPALDELPLGLGEGRVGDVALRDVDGAPDALAGARQLGNLVATSLRCAPNQPLTESEKPVIQSRPESIIWKAPSSRLAPRLLAPLLRALYRFAISFSSNARV